MKWSCCIKHRANAQRRNATIARNGHTIVEQTVLGQSVIEPNYAKPLVLGKANKSNSNLTPGATGEKDTGNIIIACVRAFVRACDAMSVAERNRAGVLSTGHHQPGTKIRIMFHF